jgi:predicted RNA-binding Zn ribbon-like protein
VVTYQIITDDVKSKKPSAKQPSFQFISGHRTLDFVATLAERYRDGIEHLREPADLDRWLHSAGIPASRPAVAQDLRQARQLREVIYRLERALVCKERADNQDITELNTWARHPRLVPQLDSGLRRTWVPAQPVSGALALIACEAIELFSGPERELIRECAAAPECSRLYLDRSRGGRRRWCQMEKCGSRAKMAQYRKRRAQEDDPDSTER